MRAQVPLQAVQACKLFTQTHCAPAGAGAMHADAAAEEGAFADVVAELMQERIDAPEGVRAFAAACRERAALLRWVASPQPCCLQQHLPRACSTHRLAGMQAPACRHARMRMQRGQGELQLNSEHGACGSSASKKALNSFHAKDRMRMQTLR